MLNDENRCDTCAGQVKKAEGKDIYAEFVQGHTSMEWRDSWNRFSVYFTNHSNKKLEIRIREVE